jgi:hypothetical protein
MEGSGPSRLVSHEHEETNGLLAILPDLLWQPKFTRKPVAEMSAQLAG